MSTEPEVEDYFKSDSVFSRVREEFLHLRYEDDNGNEKQLSTSGMVLLERLDYWTNGYAREPLHEIIREETKHIKSKTGSVDNYIEPEKAKDGLRKGWFYKSRRWMAENSHLPIGKDAVNNHLKTFLDEKWIAMRQSEERNFNNCKDIRVLFRNISLDLSKAGKPYPLKSDVIKNL